MTISVIVPSRLQRNPISERGNLFLDRSLMSVMRQTLAPAEVIVGLDAGSSAKVPVRFHDGRVEFVESPGAGQAAAVNVAVRAADSEWLALLEDDDTWSTVHLATLSEVARQGYDFVTSNQREVDIVGNWIRHNDFPTPSGWLIRAALVRDLGGFDESFRFHVDTDFLGRANAAKARRCHIVETGALSIRPEGDEVTEQHRRVAWMQMVAGHSALVESTAHEPLVTRMVNPQGGMETIARSPDAAAISRQEHERMIAKYGEVPW